MTSDDRDKLARLPREVMQARREYEHWIEEARRQFAARYYAENWQDWPSEVYDGGDNAD